MTDLERQFERMAERLVIDDRPRGEHKRTLRVQAVAVCGEQARAWSNWSGLMKGVAAAVAVAGILLAWSIMKGEDESRIADPEPARQVKPERAVEESQPTVAVELALAEQLFAAGDAKGLAALFKTGGRETKLAVVDYLRQLGTEEALAALRGLDVSGQEAAVREAVETALEASAGQAEAAAEHADDISAVAAEEEKPAMEPTEVQAVADPEETDHLQITVKVIDKASGKPIADADVRTYDGQSRYYKTDENGIALVTPVDGVTSINIFASHEGYVGQSFCCGKGHIVSTLVSEVLFALEEGSVIGGIVTDAEGRPLAGATVSFSISDGNAEYEAPETDVRFKQETDSEGRWKCTSVPKDLAWVSVNADYPGYATSRSYVDKNEQIQQLRSLSHVVVMDQGYSVSGVVTDTTGRPIYGARVQLGSTYFFKTGEYRSHTDAYGRYEFRHLRIGNSGPSYEEVEGQGVVTIRRPFEDVTVTADGYAPAHQTVVFREKSVTANFVLGPGQPLYGRVIDPNGLPVEGTTVMADNFGESHDHLCAIEWSTKTDAQGRFAWPQAPEFAIALKIRRNGFMELETDQVLAGDAEHEFVLHPEIRVRCRVVNAVTQEPVREFTFKRYEGGYISTPEKMISEAGMLETAFARQGDTFTIAFEADGYKPASSRQVRLDEQDVDLVIEMTPDGGIDGVVVNAAGRPLKGVRVIVPKGSLDVDDMQYEMARLQYHSHTVTNAQGRFHLDPVAGETFNLFALEDEGYLYVNSAEFPADKRFVLQPYAKIVGDYYKGSRPVANEQIRIDYPNYRLSYRMTQTGTMVTLGDLSINYGVVTDEQGRFVFDRLIHGRARLLVDPYQYIEVEAGKTYEVYLGGNGRTVKGRLLTPEGQPLNEDFGDCDLGLIKLSETLPIAPEEWPLPEGAQAMTYSELMAWFSQFMSTEEGRQWAGRMELKYGSLSQSYSFEPDAAGRFEKPNVEPGRYLLRAEVRPWKNPDQFPRSADYERGFIARGSAIVEVPEFETAEEMDEPVDAGVLACRAAPLAVGMRAPAFEIEDLLSGGRIRLEDYAGRAVLVNFTNPMLKEENPAGYGVLEAICRETALRQDITILNVALEAVPLPFLRGKMAAECILPGSWGTALLHQSQIYFDYEIGEIPYSVLIGPDGTILHLGSTDEQLRARLLEPAPGR